VISGGSYRGQGAASEEAAALEGASASALEGAQIDAPAKLVDVVVSVEEGIGDDGTPLFVEMWLIKPNNNKAHL